MFTFQHDLHVTREKREEVRQIILQPATREAREEKTWIWIKWKWVCKFNCDQVRLRLEPKAEEKSICCSHTAQGHDCKGSSHKNCPELLPSHAALQHAVPAVTPELTPQKHPADLGLNKRKMHFQRFCECIYSSTLTNDAAGCLKQALWLAKAQLKTVAWKTTVPNPCIAGDSGTGAGLPPKASSVNTEHSMMSLVAH